MATACWFSNLSPLFRMWAQPRQIAWLLLATGLHLALKFAFTGAAFIPMVLPLDAGVMLVPVTLLFFGPAAVWAASLSSLVFDLALQVPCPIAIPRCAGWWICGAALLRIGLRGKPGEERAARRQVFWACLAAVTAQAGWGALGAEALGWYSLGYVWFLGALSHALTLAVFGMAILRLMHAGMNDRFGGWKTAMGVAKPLREPSRTVLLLLLAGGAGGLLLALALNARAGLSPFLPSVLGFTAGPAALWAGIAALTVQCAAILIPPRASSGPAATAPESTPATRRPAWRDILGPG